MHTFVAHKWACLVLLWGLSTSLARPFEDDNLFAFAPSDGNTFTDTLPIDGGSETLLFDDFPQDFGDLNLGTGPLLGYDPSIGSGFDIAATGDCSPYGEAYQDAGAVAFSSEGCPADHSNKGCGRLGSTTVILFESRLPDYCAPANQKCCAGVSAVAFAQLTECQAAAQPASAFDQFGNFLNGVGDNVGDAWGRAVNSNPGGSLAPSGGGVLNWLWGIGGDKKKRSGDFCAAPGFS